MSPRAHDDACRAFAAEVAPRPTGSSADPVTVVGGGTHREVGGAVTRGAREVSAPVGVVEHHAEEMTVRVRAGTPLVDLGRALAASRQGVDLPDAGGSTVGGVLSVGRSGLRRLGTGDIRDTVLEATFVLADGRLARAGGPTVKNVSGFDLCRLLVGSLGRLACLAELVLRTRPLPETTRWLRGPADPAEVRSRLHRPLSLLWDGEEVWVELGGHAGDVEGDSSTLAELGVDRNAAGPPPLPPCRWSTDPSARPDREATGSFVLEVGVGVLHAERPPPIQEAAAEVEELHRRLYDRFDPTRRLNPGRDPLHEVSSTGWTTET